MTDNASGSVEELLSVMNLLGLELRRAAVTHPKVPRSCQIKIASCIRRFTRAGFVLGQHVEGLPDIPGDNPAGLKDWSALSNVTYERAALMVVGRWVAHVVTDIEMQPQRIPLRQPNRYKRSDYVGIPSQLYELAEKLGNAEDQIRGGDAVGVLAEFVDPNIRLRHALHSLHIPPRVIRARVSDLGVVMGDVCVNAHSETLVRLVAALTTEKGPQKYSEEPSDFMDKHERHVDEVWRDLFRLQQLNRGRMDGPSALDITDERVTSGIELASMTVHYAAELAEIKLVPVPEGRGIGTLVDRISRAYPSTVELAFDITRGPPPFSS